MYLHSVVRIVTVSNLQKISSGNRLESNINLYFPGYLRLDQYLRQKNLFLRDAKVLLADSNYNTPPSEGSQARKEDTFIYKDQKKVVIIDKPCKV